MTKRIITKEQIFSGWGMEQFDGSKYSDIMHFVPERGCFELRGVACRSGVDGTCQCNGHETYDYQDRDIAWGFETLKKWGFVIQDNVDLKKMRRRIEDALRKNTSDDQLFAIAGLLNVRIDEEPIAKVTFDFQDSQHDRERAMERVEVEHGPGYWNHTEGSGPHVERIGYYKI